MKSKKDIMKKWKPIIDGMGLSGSHSNWLSEYAELHSGCSKKGYSNVSQELFNTISNNKNNIFYATKNNEYKINRDKGYYLYDYTDLSTKRIIEFQGDKYHANPLLYESFDNPHPFYKNKKSIDIYGKRIN